MLDRRSQRANGSTLLEAKKRSSLAMRKGSNNDMQRRARTRVRMKANARRAPADVRPLYVEQKDHGKNAPRRAAPTQYGERIYEANAVERCAGWRSLRATARLMYFNTHNKCVQWSAAIEFQIVTSMLHAAPTNAQR